MRPATTRGPGRGAAPIMTVDAAATRIAGHSLFRGGTADLVRTVATLIDSPSSHLIVTPNVDQVLLAAQDPVAAQAFADASVLLADGAPLIGLARLLGDRDIQRHTGADLIQLATAEAATRGWRIAIVGGAPAVSRAAAECLRAEHPGADVRAIDTPELTDAEDPAGAAVVDSITRMRPHLVFLCLGFPLQERWWAHWGRLLPAALYVGAGAAVDFAAGAKARAPLAIQRCGLEWLWRLAQEPRRLAHRYLIRGPRFAATIVRSLVHAGRTRSDPEADDEGPISVIHAVDSMTGGGAQQVVIDLTNWSLASGHAVAIVGRDGARASRIPSGAAFFRVASRSFPGYVIALLRACRKVGPTVLHAHQRREALACGIVGRLLGIPVVEHAHTVLPTQRLRRLSYRSARIFSVGPAVTRMLVERFRVEPARITTIGNLVPAAAFENARTRRPGRARRRRAGEKVVLGVGRLEPQKDPHRFVDIVAELGGGFRGVWFGDGSLREAVSRRISDTDAAVHLAGPTDAIIDELDAADCLLVTSRWEGTPLVMLEAFARGLPVIGVDAPGTRDLLEGRGRVLPATLTPSESAAIVREVLDEGCAASTAAALAYAREYADPHTVYAPVLAAYRRSTTR